MKKTWTLGMCTFALIVFTGIGFGLVLAGEKTPEDLAPASTGGMGGIIEGKIVDVESQTLVVEKNNGKVVRVHMPGKSGDAAGDFKEGDYIEAAVSPEGITTSVRVVANPNKHDINPNIR